MLVDLRLLLEEQHVHSLLPLLCARRRSFRLVFVHVLFILILFFSAIVVLFFVRLLFAPEVVQFII